MKSQLLLDKESVAQASDVTFHLTVASKHPQNPLLVPGEHHQWDSLQVCWPATVLYDAEFGLFRCWYHGLDAVQENRPGSARRGWNYMPGYAESRDGLNWIKPELGFHTHRNAPTNRIGTDWDGWCLSCVFFNPNPSDRHRRFLSFWKDRKSFTEPQMPRVLASSPDGKMWHYEKIAYKEPPPRTMMQDFWQVLYDAEAEDPNFRYRAYSQYWSPKVEGGRLIRQIGMHHGPEIDALQDAQPPIVMAPMEGVDDEIHFASVYRTGGNYLMLLESDRFASKPIHGDLRLAVSGDGQSFRRVHPRTAVVPTGGRGTWEENLLVTTSHSILEVGDELWIFYHGCPGVFTNWPYDDEFALRGSMFYPTYLGLAVLPRDRFGYAQGPGEIVTHPLKMGDGALWINAEGEVTVELKDSDGRALQRGSLSEERSQTVYRKISWDKTPQDQTTSLHIRLGPEGRLYSIKY